MPATPQNLMMMVDRLPEGAVAAGVHDARAGLEDTPHLSKGRLAQGKRPLIERGKISDRRPRTTKPAKSLTWRANSWVRGQDLNL